MGSFEDILALFKKYENGLGNGYPFYVKGNIPNRIIDNAIKKYAPEVRRGAVIGICDTTVFGSGKEGYLFTDTAVYWVDVLERPKKLCYRDIKDVKTGVYCTELYIHGGSTITWSDTYLDKKYLCKLFTELLAMDNISQPTNEVSDLNDKIGKLEMLFTDVETEGMKRGYERAAREYSIVYQQIEEEYKSTKRILDDHIMSNDEKSEVLIQKHEELTAVREQLEDMVQSKTSAVAKKYNTSPVIICQALAGGAIFNHSSQIDILSLIYNHKEKKLLAAERKGYAEAKELHQKKAAALQRDLKSMKEKGNEELRNLMDLIIEIYSAICDEQQKIADLRILL